MSTIEWLSRLVSLDTTTRNSNLPLIEVLEAFFSKQRISVRISRDPKQPKANLFATIAAQDGNTNGGLVLSGHTDVVPVDGQDWKTNPFEAVQIHDRIFGRGTCDMKGFLAVVLALAPEFQKLQLKRPLHFAFSYDEEGGCFGAPVMIADLKKAGIKPSACIVGEPTGMLPIVAHKGFNVLHCQVKGQAAHSSQTSKGCNAIEYGAKLIQHIRQVADQIRCKGPFDEAFDVPYTTLSTNLIQGGNAVNTIPDMCAFYLDLRPLPEVNPQDIIDQLQTHARVELLPSMQQESADADVVINTMVSIPSFESSEKTEINRLTRTLLHDQEVRKAAYGTEAGLFQAAGMATILCGPGSIDEAHRANEFVTIEQLKKCEVFLRAVVEKYCI